MIEFAKKLCDPFEVASGCDIVQIGKDYPWMITSGGIDKRVLTQDINTIDRYLGGILPSNRSQGINMDYCPNNEGKGWLKK